MEPREEGRDAQGLNVVNTPSLSTHWILMVMLGAGRDFQISGKRD